MEHTLFSTVAMLGLDAILIATLALFALHAIDTWWSRRKDIAPSQESADAVDCQLHAFPQLRHAAIEDQDEETTRRAA